QTPLTPRLAKSNHLKSAPLRGQTRDLPCYHFLGPQHGADIIRIGIFAGIHGDEPATASACIKFLELLDEGPDLARDFALRVYPVCNPTGYELNTREAASGKDLNREFWKGSVEPEVQMLEHELATNRFNGIIS